MTIPLTCRLLESRVLLRTEVALSLRECIVRGISLVQALVERVPGALPILEEEFARFRGPTVSLLAPDADIVGRLPVGMCERLLAVPLVRSNQSDPVSIAVVDPYDLHIPREFEYCLGHAVTTARASFKEVVDALDHVRGKGRFEQPEQLLDVGDDDTPAFGTRMLRESKYLRKPRDSSRHLPSVRGRGVVAPPVHPLLEPEEAPLALVRPSHSTRPKAERPSTESSVDAKVSSEEREGRDSEPVLRLVKQKSQPSFRFSSAPPPAQQDVDISPQRILDRLGEAPSPRQVLDAIKVCLATTAPCQVLLTVRGDKFLFEWSKLHRDVNRYALTAEQQAMLSNACRVGHYLGPLPPDGNTQGLGAALGLRAREEIYIAPISVADRVAVLMIVGRFDEAFSVTRWMDAVASRASTVLERLARQRKQF